ncbi:chromate efflux transporter [Marinimicrobium sp. C2-29]|uniref:chromate efflux transporter n=1 Tax=Marinimicrobium sp. C2-29 TaxID=3139825 RepID=UPI003139DA77
MSDRNYRPRIFLHLNIFWVFLKLGCTSFGGPVAHLGYFREEFVARRRWLTDQAYADLMALCQFLPGPASSQVGMGLGLSHGGVGGALAAWLGFTLPSAVLMIAFGLALLNTNLTTGTDWLNGLKVVAVAVVAQALWGMGKNLCPDRARASLAAVAALLVIALPGTWGQLLAMAAGGLIGWRWLHPTQTVSAGNLPSTGKALGIASLALFAVLLFGLPLLANFSDNAYLGLFDSFYRAGSLVFGGGHVVLPLLQAELVPQGTVSNDLFLAGYGAAQAVPGPLFTFAGYLGAVTGTGPHAVLLAMTALVGIFLPGFLLLLGILPLWASARRHPSMQKAMLGVNAAVVGLLLAAFYDPVWTSAIHSSGDFALALAAFVALMFWRLPPWLVVILCAVLPALIGLL